MNAIWIRGFICGFALATALGFAAWGWLRVPAPVLKLAEAPQATAPHRVIQRLEEIRPIEAETDEEKQLRGCQRTGWAIVDSPGFPSLPGQLFGSL